MHKSGLDGVLCGVDLGPFSPGRPTGPKPPGSRAPTLQGRVEPWRVSPHFLPRPGHPLLPASPPKLPALLLHPRRPCSGPESRQEPGRSLRGEKGPREGKEEAAEATRCKKFPRTPADTTPIPFSGQNPSNLLAFPRRFILELTAGRPAEQDNQKQNEEAKTALGVTHLYLSHLDRSFARVRVCQVRTCDPLPLGGSCGLDLRLCADCLGGPSADRPRPGFPLEASRQGLGWALLSAPSLTGLPSCKPAYPPVYPGRQRALVTGDSKLLFLQFSSVQSLSRVRLFETSWIAAHQASLSITTSCSLVKLMSTESVMPCNHLILCCPLLLPLSIFPSIRVFSSDSVLCIRWPKDWSFSFNISPSNEYSGLISFRIDWFDLLAVQGTLKSLLQHHNSKALILQCSAFFMVQLLYPYINY